MSKYKQIQVLVIDDDEMITNLVEYILLDLGITKILKADGIQMALNTFTDKSQKTHLIICDWLMPGMTGLEFLEMVRAVDKTVPFLMITSKADEEAVMSAKKKGVTDYIRKPVDVAAVKPRLKKYLDNVLAEIEP